MHYVSSDYHLGEVTLPGESRLRQVINCTICDALVLPPCVLHIKISHKLVCLNTTTTFKLYLFDRWHHISHSALNNPDADIALHNNLPLLYAKWFMKQYKLISSYSYCLHIRLRLAELDTTDRISISVSLCQCVRSVTDLFQERFLQVLREVSWLNIHLQRESAKFNL